MNGRRLFCSRYYLSAPETSVVRQRPKVCFADLFRIIVSTMKSRLILLAPDLGMSENRQMSDHKKPPAAVTSIGGFLSIDGNTDLTDLNGLSSLTSVGSFMSIAGNADLTDLNGLSSLTSVGGVYISDNVVLTNLNGLSGLNSIEGDLFISNNDDLTDLSGLEDLTSVKGSLNIAGNADLTDLNGLSSLTSIGSSLSISNNPALADLNGLILVANGGSGVLNNISGDSTIQGNTSLCTSDVNTFHDQEGLTCPS